LIYYELLKIFLSVIFSISSLGKLSGLSGFQSSLYELKIGDKYVKVISYAIPIVELCLAVLLILSSPFSNIGEFGIFIILIGFSWSVWRAYLIGSTVKCNCFGNLVNEKLGTPTIAKIILIIIFDIYLVLNNNLNKSLNYFTPGEVFSMVYSSVSLFLIYSVVMLLGSKRTAKRT